MVKLSKRAQNAIKLMNDGAYWRKQLETVRLGPSRFSFGEKFKRRLRNANGHPIKGFSDKTFFELEKAGLLQWRECPTSSVWPEEHILK